MFKKMWERVGAIIFVLCFPLLCLPILSIKSTRTTSNNKLFVFTFTLQTLVTSFLISFWIHFIPCFWMSCDRSDAFGRGILWLVSWFVLIILFIGILKQKPAYQIIKYSSPEAPQK